MKDNNEIIHFSKKIKILQHLGILDCDCNITPEAFVGYITRLPVNKQAEAMGIPLIMLPPLPKNGSPERKILTFLKNQKNLYASGGFEESYLIRSLISTIINDFNLKKRTHDLTKEKITEIAKCIKGFSEADVVSRLEENHTAFARHFMFSYALEYPDVPKQDHFTKEDLHIRFKKIKHFRLEYGANNDLASAEAAAIKYLKSKSRANEYVELMTKYLYLWRSLEKEKWSELIKVSLTHWGKMSAGWPDINVIGPHKQMTLIEVKGKDKIHTSQVFTLLKLKEVLGPNRLAIAWVNKVAYDPSFNNKEYKQSVLDWINTPADKRNNSIKHPIWFYNNKNSIDYL